MYQMTVWQNLSESELAKQFEVKSSPHLGQVLKDKTAQDNQAIVSVSSSKQKRDIKQSLLVMEGRDAKIHSGQTKLINVQQPHYIRSAGSSTGGYQHVEHRNINIALVAENGFVVTVNSLPHNSKQVVLDVTPFTGEIDDNSNTVSGSTASTSIVAPLGEWVVIAVSDINEQPDDSFVVVGNRGAHALSASSSGRQKQVVLVRVVRE